MNNYNQLHRLKTIPSNQTKRELTRVKTPSPRSSFDKSLIGTLSFYYEARGTNIPLA